VKIPMPALRHLTPLLVFLKAIPAWIFHGATDATVPPSESIDLAHALQGLGATVKLTIYPGVGHEKWDVTYSDPALYAWLLAQSK
jgi:predicted esterase